MAGEQQRNPKGQFLPLAPGEAGAATTHGARRFELTGAAPRELLEQQREDVAGLISDLGGAGNLTTARRLLVEQAGSLVTMARLFDLHFRASGVTTPRGRVRAAAASYLSTVDRLVRVLAALGLERTARDVTTPPWLAAQGPQDASGATSATDQGTDTGGIDRA